jgi:hypothetical protein
VIIGVQGRIDAIDSPPLGYFTILKQPKKDFLNGCQQFFGYTSEQ